MKSNVEASFESFAQEVFDDVLKLLGSFDYRNVKYESSSHNSSQKMVVKFKGSKDAILFATLVQNRLSEAWARIFPGYHKVFKGYNVTSGIHYNLKTPNSPRRPYSVSNRTVSVVVLSDIRTSSLLEHEIKKLKDLIQTAEHGLLFAKRNVLDIEDKIKKHKASLQEKEAQLAALTPTL